MQHDFENIDALIAKLGAGEASPEEVAFIEAWRKSSAQNENYFHDTVKLNKAIGDSLITAVDVDAAWRKLDQRISGEAKVIHLHSRRLYARIAASLILLACLGLIIRWFFGQANETSLSYKSGSALTEQVLPDGSKVFMNRNTEISYVTNRQGQREVKLKGEAFFEVVHDENKPFVVNVEEVMIKDIGTAFNVKENLQDKSIDVLVESGEVQFFSGHDPGISLKEGEKASYNLVTKQFTRSHVSPSENTLSYKSKIFEFRETRLRDVVTQLNEAYGCKIMLANDAIGEQHLSVVFNNENPDLIINIIAETLDLDVEKRGDSVLFKNKVLFNK